MPIELSYKKILINVPGIFFYVLSVLKINYLPLENNALIAVSIALFMINLWITEILPVWVTALLPIILFPLHGISPFSKIIPNYYDKNILLFLGGFLIAYTIEKWGLHKRFAYKVLSFSNQKANTIVLAVLVSTFFCSMWMSNTATAIMFLPIVSSIIKIAETEMEDINHFRICLLLSVAYGANIGGITTPIGTPPNIVYKSMSESVLGQSIGFGEWILMAFPVGLLMLFFVYFYLTKLQNKLSLKPLNSVAKFLDEHSKNNRLTRIEKRVLLVFGITVLLWIFGDVLSKYFTQKYFNFQIKEYAVALIFASLFFIIPQINNFKKTLLNYQDLLKINYGILILFGGGISLAKALEETQVVQLIGSGLFHNSNNNIALLLFFAIFIALFLTEVMSNVALVNIFIPVILGMATSLGNYSIHNIGIPVTIAASFAFMLPISTPPNAVVYSTGFLPIKKMVISGFVINFVGLILLWFLGYYILPLWHF